MPSAMKRKSSPGAEKDNEPAKRRFAEDITKNEETAESHTDSQEATAGIAAATTPSDSTDDAAAKARERKERFAALKARNTDSRKANYKETTAETQRSSVDPSLLTALNRKKDTAAHKLLKADTEAAGEDFERKRAWDWTIEESEKWDKRMEKKGKHRDDVAFQDFRQDARKVYKRQLRDMKPDREAYEKDKAALIERAAASGGLEVVETEEGELIAVDRDGRFYSTAESTDFVGNKPPKEAVDKLVGEIQKAEEVRMKKRKDRKGDDDGDVTYINDKNKQVSASAVDAMWCILIRNSSTRNWRGSTTSTLRISGRASNVVLLCELCSMTTNDTQEIDTENVRLLCVLLFLLIVACS